MAITLGAGPPAYCGPGFRVVVDNVAGPVPNDDFLQVELLDHSAGGFGMYGVLRPIVAGYNLVTIGWDARNQFVMAGSNVGLANGAAIDVQVTQYHANFTVVDSIAATPWGVLDTHSWAWTLVRFLGGGLGGPIDDLLAAVQRTFPATN